MLVGFIAVIVILLVIIGLFSSNLLSSNSKGAQYVTEAQKVNIMLSNMNGQAKFYYGGHGSYKDISVQYFKDIGFKEAKIVNQDPSGSMDSDHWENWPTGVTSPYTGPYIELGGSAGGQLRILVVPQNDDQNAGFFILKEKANTLDPTFLKILERTLAGDSAYIGG